jgi:DNA-binding HxlR family transcriptional regulator
MRLKELTNAFLIEKTLDGYALTELGRRIYQLLEPMGKLAKEWSVKFK